MVPRAQETKRVPLTLLIARQQNQHRQHGKEAAITSKLSEGNSEDNGSGMQTVRILNTDAFDPTTCGLTQ